MVINNKTIIMRGTYVPPSSSSFDICFSPKHISKGGSLNDIRIYDPYFKTTGGSFLGVLSNIVSRAIPFLKRVILPEAGIFARNILDDFNNNEIPIKKSLRKSNVKSTFSL